MSEEIRLTVYLQCFNSLKYDTIMRSQRFLSILFLLFVLAACSAKQIQQTKGIQKQYVVANAPNHSYEIYLPAGYDSTKTYPVIFSFDSHGSGSTAIAGFKHGADRFGFIIIGSNLIKNGIPEYDKRISELVTDVKNRFPIDNKAIFTAGFSGGARMANYYGLQNQCAGVISCGAGFRQKDIQSTGIQIYIYNIAGTRDCNFGETAYLPGSTECYAPKYISRQFIGTHEWPIIPVLTEAVEFMYVRLVLDKVREENGVSLSAILEEKNAEIDSIKKTGNKLELYKKIEITSKMFAGNSDGNDFAEKLTTMDKDEAFKASLSSMQQALQMETMIDQGYVSAMTDESIAWWTRELKALDDSTKSNKKGEMIDMMFRVKGYIGLICFSVTSNAAKKKDIAQLEKVLTIYEMAEPKNPDVFYYKAFDAFLKKQKDGIKLNMEKAYNLGFDDSVRFRTDFPADVVSQIGWKQSSIKASVK